MNKGPGASLLLLVAVLFTFGVFVIPEPAPQIATTDNTIKTEPAITGFTATINHEYSELIAKVQSDIEQVLGDKIHITVLVGPYYRHYSFIAFLDTFNEPYFYLSLDGEVLKELTSAEINAVIIHELGHVLYRPPPHPSRSQAVEAEVLADGFVNKYPKYSSPKDMISALGKAYGDYLTRIKKLEKLARGQ